MIKLHLCSGLDYRPGFTNVDALPGGPQDVTADLNGPWTFAQDASVEHILIKDGFEHLTSLEHFLGEAERVLVPGGTVEIQVPHFRSPSAYRLTHKHLFSWSFFDVFPEPHDTIQNLRVRSNELIVESKPAFKLVNTVANLAPKFWERLFYVSGIRVVLEKPQKLAPGAAASTHVAHRSDSPLSTGTLELLLQVSRHIPHGQSVLEVGCGNGHLSERILANDNQLLGLDISKPAVEECKRKFGDRARFLDADIVTFRTDERFDYVFINEVLDQIPDDDAALTSVFQVLKPGGHLVLSTPITGDRFPEVSLRTYTEQEIRQKVLSAGFELEVEDSYGGALANAAAQASKKIRFPQPLLSAVRKSPVYRALMTADAKLKLKKDRLILVARKPAA